MLNFFAHQMNALTQAAVLRFEAEMVAHAQQFSPRLSAVLGAAALPLVIRAAGARAGRHGFTNRGPVRLCVEMTFLYGSAFDTDPQYPWAASILAGDADQMARAERLYEQVLDYQERVSGPRTAHTRDALRKLAVWGRHVPEFGPAEFIEGAMWELRQLFPRKADYLGDEALRALVHEACGSARDAAFHSSRAHLLMVALMFAFGHGCADDPLYPWIGRTLRDPTIVDPAARATRLERKALTWLDHVLAGNAREERLS